MNNIIIRKAIEQDTELILSFIHEIAVYEKLSHEVVATVDSVREALFGSKSVAEALLCYADSIPVGYAIFFHNFSTFVGKKGIYLEDLYVKPDYRGRGIGKKILRHIAQIAVERNCGRMEWAVLDWNTPAIEFYKSIGAVAMNEWTIFRLNENALKDFAVSE